MKFKARITTALVAVFLCLASLSGCSTIAKFSDYVSENPVVASIATRQAVGRFIAAGNSPEVERERALAVHERAERVLKYLDGSPTATYDTLVSVLESSVDWSSLDQMDRLLIQDILNLAKQELKKHALNGDVLPDDALLNLRGLLLTASETARYFLELP